MVNIVHYMSIFFIYILENKYGLLVVLVKMNVCA